MNKLHVSARMKIREGKLGGFKQQAAECIRQTKEKDTGTLGRLFEEFAYDHNVVVYGDPSPQLLEGARIMMPDVEIKVYSFLQGLSEER